MAEAPEEDLNDLLLDQDEEIPTDFLEGEKDILREANIRTSFKETEGLGSNLRSIHDKESIDFYRQELGASEWVIDLLENFHKIPFTSTPTKYREKNNKSAVEEKDILWIKMQEWEKCGFVTRVAKAPTCVSPIVESQL